jgi:beta-lactam-binding protein with PASTA domain
MLMRIAIVATLSMLTTPVIGEGQGQAHTPPPPPGEDYGTSISSRTTQVMTIPPVIGMTTNAAIDALAVTRLQIVPRDSITSSVPAGHIVDQRPRAGTPVSRARAETLFVAKQQKPKRGANCWWCALVAEIIPELTKPPAAPPHDSSVGPPVNVPVQPTDDTGGSPEMVPGTDLQKRTRVPDLYQSTPNMASAALERSRLNLTNLGTDYSDDVPNGRVFKQQPIAGTEVATSTYVGVWYSRGPHPPAPTFKVPPVIGLELAEAADSLKRSGFRAGQVTYLRRQGAEKKVVQQSPAEGESAHRNDAVDLTITTPPSQLTVPSVIELTREGARRRLAEVGLGIGRYTLVVLADRANGIVSQKPSAGATADSGSLVDLVENRPPEVRRVRVPDLSGKSVAASDSALQRDSLVLGDVLRPGINAVDQVIDQRPHPGDTVFMHSPVTIALGVATGPPPDRMIRLPGVVNLTVDSARRMLSDSGFTRISIGGGGGRFTSASIVESQTPPAGTFVTPATLVSIVARAAPPLLPMPDFVRQRPQVARVAAELDSLRMIVVSEVRSFRLHDEIVRQYPVAGESRRVDRTVDVVVETPFIPPLAAAVLGLGVVGGVGGEGVRRWRRRNRGKQPTSGVMLKPVTSVPAPPILHAEALGSLIKGSFTLHFGVESSPSTLEVQGDSLVKPEK